MENIAKEQENKMFEHIFTDMPFDEAKKLIIERINKSVDYDSLASNLWAGLKVTSLNVKEKQGS